MKFTYHVGTILEDKKGAGLVLKRRRYPDWMEIYMDVKAEFDHYDKAAAFAKQNGLKVVAETVF